MTTIIVHMSKIYLQMKKVYQKTLSPPYSILDQPPEQITRGTVGLDLDECVDACTCVPSENGKELHMHIWRISNIDGQIQEQLLESFFLEKW